MVILVVVLTHWSILVPSLGSCFKSLFAIACMTINCQPKLYNQDSPISHNEFLLFHVFLQRSLPALRQLTPDSTAFIQQSQGLQGSAVVLTSSNTAGATATAPRTLIQPALSNSSQTASLVNRPTCIIYLLCCLLRCNDTAGIINANSTLQVNEVFGLNLH